MPEYGVTNKGFVLKRLDTILNEVQTEISGLIGFDVAQNPQSLLNSTLIVPFCDEIAALWELAQESYYAKYPATAEGVSLDNACQYGNIFRKGNLPTEYLIHAKARDGTVVPRGSLIASITNPVVSLKCAQETTVERANCNSIAIKPVTTSSGTYTIVVNNATASLSVGSSTDAETLVGDFVDVIQAIADFDEYTVSAVLDGTRSYIVIDDNVKTRSNEVQLTNNLTSEYVVTTIPYYTVDYGEIVLPKETITTITSNVTGLIGVTNLVTPKAGRLQQTDTELRRDYISKSYSNSSTQTNSIESSILDDVQGVVSVRCYENVDMTTDEYGRPPKSIEVIVDGGDEVEIATAILARKAGGIQTYGDIGINIMGEYGDRMTVYFRRPEPVYAYIKVEITPGSRAVDPNYYDIVANQILSASENLTIGDSFMSQAYIQGIYDALPGIMYCKISVYGSNTPYDDSPDYEEGNIIITQRQKLNLSADRIEVTVDS